MSTMSTSAPTTTTISSSSAGENTDGKVKIKTIRVLLLRHGERQDETDSYDRNQHTKQERIDPLLTSFGHCQALHAWQNILLQMCFMINNNDDNALPQNIFLATSPMRRCVGTAIMVGSALQTINSQQIRFVLPTTATTTPTMTTTTTTTTTTTIPILVMNGLGDCAAQIQRMGGMGQVIKDGWLCLGSSPSNDYYCYCYQKEESNNNNKKANQNKTTSTATTTTKTNASTTTTTRFQQCLQSIASTAVLVEAKENEQEVEKRKLLHHQQQATSSPTLTQQQEQQQQPPKIQFWRESSYHYHYKEPIPSQHLQSMTLSLSIQEHANNTNNNNTNTTTTTTTPHQDRPSPMTKNAPSSEECCKQALVRAVLQTAMMKDADTTTTCILVTHREAIRYVENNWVNTKKHNNNNNKSIRTHHHRHRHDASSMYCCVGIYNVKVDLEQQQILQWDHHNEGEGEGGGVIPYQLLRPN